ncbi:MAG: FecR domain-containing protein [Gallionella sp.]|jgi:hypothetical protein|nr:FecR domain-containing protein [Gallionella sp.]
MKNFNKLLASLGLTVACFMAASSFAYATVAGHVQFVSGNVQVISSVGLARVAKKGDAVNEGDTLISAQQSSAQIKMQDGGFIAVRPNTKLKIEQFRFSGQSETGSDRSFFSLIKGGFRSITGLIGRVNKQNYRVTTPAATIGIRGTDYEAVYVEAAPVKVAAADMLMAQTDAPSPIMGGGFAAAVVNKGAIEMGTDKGKTLLQPGQGMVVSYGMNQLPVVKPLDVNLFPGAGNDEPAGQNGDKGANGEKQGDTKQGDTKQDDTKQDDTKKDDTKKKQGSSGENGQSGESNKAADNGQGGADSTSQSTAEGGAAGAATQESTAATAPQEIAPIRETSVVDAAPPSTGGIPSATTPAVSAATPATEVIQLPATTPSTTITTQPDAAGTTLNLTTNTATTRTGQTVPITQSLVATQAQAAATAAATAAQAAATAAAAVQTANNQLVVIPQVPITPATAAISVATTDVAGADAAVTSASALTLADAVTAAANAASIQTATTAAIAQANAAQTALTANGTFADSTAGSANTAVQTASTALQTANTDVQTAAGTVTAQNTALTAAQTAAATALTSANANLTTANTGLTTASTQNDAIAAVQSATPTLVTAAQTAVTNAQSAAANAQLAADEAVIFQAAGDLANAQAQLLIAQQQQAIAEQQLALAQTAQTSAASQLASAQAAAAAAQTAVDAASLAAANAALDAATASTEAVAAQTAASSAAAAYAQTDPAVISPAPSAASLVQTNSATIVANAPIAAYNNPAVVTTDRFIGIMSTVQPDTVGGSGYIEGYGPGAGFTSVGAANTSFVLDGAGNLVESRHAWYEETAASTATPQVVVVDANVKRTGGTAMEAFKMADNSIYAGRWVGGTITVSDNVVGIPPIPTFTRNLGATSEHWAILLAPPAGYVQTLGGVATYNKVAATSPTDALGTAGVLNSATLTANFTSQLVDAALNLTIAGKTLDVVAAGMAINQSFFSTGTQVTATCTGCAGTYFANVGGGFAGDAAASVGLNYTLWTGAAPGATTGATDLIQGMVAFSAATTPAAVQAQPFAQTDVSFELSTGSGYASMSFGGNGMTAAANVAPTAATPSFGWSEGCTGCGSYAVTLPGATGAVNGNAASFATTGIQFGRWADVPTLSQTSASIAFGPGKNYGYGPESWAFAPEGYLDTPTTLSAATGGTAVGVFSYALNGAPAPKDSSGAAGTLNSLSLTADFTAQTVTAALSVSLGATTWNAGSAFPMGIGAFNGASAGFGGNLTVTSSNASVSTYGYLSGAFTGQNYAGAIVEYQIQEWPQAGGATTANLTGVAALTRNGVAGNATVANGATPATGKFVVAEAGSYGIWQQTVDTATTTGGVLTSFGYNAGAGNTSTTTINCVTCAGQAAADAATGIQFGAWDEGTRAYSYTTPFGGQFHWIQGPGLDPIYLPEVLLGSMSYALDGGTAPTNQYGQAGALSSASLTVNFTNQTVDIALGLTGVNGHNWSATAAGVPLSWSNYSKNAFWATTGTGVANVLSVTMDAATPGATTGTGSLSGQLTGSGLDGALFQYQLSASMAMPTVPSSFTSADMVAVRAPSVTVTGPVVTGGTVSVAFPAGDPNATLAVQPATALSLTLANGQPLAAALSGGITASVASLTADQSKTGAYFGMAASGETFSMDTYGSSYSAKYSNFGEWRLLPTPAGLAPATATGPFSSGEFAGGMLMTPSTSMPVSNFAVNGYYYGAMVGGAQNSATNTPYTLLGGVSLFANFTTGALSGTATGIQVVDRTTGGAVGYFNDLSLAATIATNAFSGAVTAGAAPAGLTASPVNVAAGTLGSTSGHFYGPTANELTGIWQLASGTIQASGAFGAGNGTSNTAPLEMVNGTVALVASAPADTATAYRLVGMSGFNSVSVTSSGMVDGAYNNATRVTEVAGGVTAFDTGFNANGMTDTGSSRLSIGTATQTGLGTDPTTGISWGRWVGGSVDVTDRATGAVTPTALGSASLHWIATPTMTAPVALPVSGVYNYVLGGGTAPTDNLGAIGTLNSATLVANFTAQTVDVGVNVGINSMTLTASGTAIPIQQRSMFSANTFVVGGGALSASCTGAGCSGTTQADIGGAFTGAAGAGAAMIYGFTNGASVVSGAAAFQKGAAIP